METLDLLEELLLDYRGTVLLVSHDRSFLNNVVTSSLIFDGSGKVDEVIGGYDDWLATQPETITPAKKEKMKPAPRKQRPRKLSFREKLYVSVDIVGVDSLFEIAFAFSKEGGKLLIFDEVHKYQNFEQELKNIYDMLDLQVIFSGSSALKLDNAKADLSRRAVMHVLPVLSFREYLELETKETNQMACFDNFCFI
jgi:hypothetical protein